MQKFIVVLLSFMLIVMPVYAQETLVEPRPTATPISVTVDPGSGFNVNIPEGSPWWAGVALTIIGAGAFLLRGYSGRLDTKQQAAIEAQQVQFDAAEKERERKHQIEVERLRAQQTADSSAAVRIDSLAGAMSEMAQSINNTVTVLAQERLQAGSERDRILKTMEEQSKGIQERNKLLREVGNQVNQIDKKLTPLDGALASILTELRALKEHLDDLVTRAQMEHVIQELTRIKGSTDAVPAESAPAKDATIVPETKTE